MTGDAREGPPLSFSEGGWKGALVAGPVTKYIINIRINKKGYMKWERKSQYSALQAQSARR